MSFGAKVLSFYVTLRPESVGPIKENTQEALRLFVRKNGSSNP